MKFLLGPLAYFQGLCFHSLLANQGVPLRFPCTEPRLEATLVSLLEDLLLLPITLALTFGSMATLLLFVRPGPVKQEKMGGMNMGWMVGKWMLAEI